MTSGPNAVQSHAATACEAGKRAYDPTPAPRGMERGITSPTTPAFARRAASTPILDLGTLPGGGQSFAYALNADGVIVGESDTPGGRRAVRWTVTNGSPAITDLTTVASFPAGTAATSAFDINTRGLVVGVMEAIGGRRAFLLEGTVLTDLGVLPGDVHSSAAALNDAVPVQVVGASGSSAFIWTAATGMQALPHLSLDGPTFATGVNAAGIVIGYSSVANASSAVRWQQGQGGWTVTELPSGAFAGATDLNESGDATGSRRSATGMAHAYLWPTGGGSVDLGTLGGNASHALGINGGGETVGWSYNRTGVQRAFWWNGTRMTDLGALVKVGQAGAEAINDRGLVVGWSRTSGGSGALSHAVLWTTR